MKSALTINSATTCISLTSDQEYWITNISSSDYF